MLKITYVSILLVFINVQLFSQDVILKYNNELISCKITQVDSIGIHYLTFKNQDTLDWSIPLASVRSYEWNDNVYNLSAARDSLTNESNENFLADSANAVSNEAGKVSPYKIEPYNFLYLMDDSVLKVHRLELNQPLMGPSYFMADGKKVDGRFVKFFQNDYGFYSNLMNVKGTYNPEFSLCEVHGKINLFSHVVYSMGTTYGLGSEYYDSGYSDGLYLNWSVTHYYYNKDFGDLKKVNYKNLKTDLADNPESMKYLTDYKRASDNAVLLAITGYTIMTLTTISLINKMNHDPNIYNTNDPNYVPPYMGPHTAGILGGLLLVWSKNIFIDHGSKPEALRKAIESYNN